MSYTLQIVVSDDTVKEIDRVRGAATRSGFCRAAISTYLRDELWTMSQELPGVVPFVPPQFRRDES